MLLYAQPLTRIRVLSLTDIMREHDGNVHIRFGDPLCSVPEPFDSLLLDLAADREHLTNAANVGTTWLFPGQRSGQPIGYIPLQRRLKAIGLSPGRARVAALRRLVLEIAAPVAATALGFHRTTTHRQAVNAGGVWNRYAAGAHPPEMQTT
jgi:hypothetical protein